MKGEFISIETTQIMADYDLHLHTVDGLVIKRILNILEGKDEKSNIE